MSSEGRPSNGSGFDSECAGAAFQHPARLPHHPAAAVSLRREATEMIMILSQLAVPWHFFPVPQVTQTNVVCRVGKAVPLGSSNKAAGASAVAAAAAAKVPLYRYSKPGKHGNLLAGAVGSGGSLPSVWWLPCRAARPRSMKDSSSDPRRMSSGPGSCRPGIPEHPSCPPVPLPPALQQSGCR